jgi:putative methionine-R-sulfoxide reductase with GAF domain
MKGAKPKHSGNQPHQEERTIAPNPPSLRSRSFNSIKNQEQADFLGSKESLIKSQELAHLGSWEWDLPADKITWSPELYRIYDINPQTQLSYDKLMERVHPDDRDYHNKIVDDWIKNRQGGPFEYRILRPDGSIRFVHGESEIFCDNTGKPIRMFGIVQDITERKHTEKLIQRKNQIQRVINEILNLSLESRSLEEILECALEQIVSIDWLQLKSQGAVFLVGENSDELVLKASRELPEELKTICSRISIGKCLCGLAASKKEVLFKNYLDDCHETRCVTMAPHAQYCVPIQSSGNILGVLNLYVDEPLC